MSIRPRTKTITRVDTNPEAEEPSAAFFSQQKRPESLQFRLQVDRQTKASYTTYEAAQQAGLAIKQGHPILRVAVYDGVNGVNTIIELPEPTEA